MKTFVLDLNVPKKDTRNALCNAINVAMMVGGHSAPSGEVTVFVRGAASAADKRAIETAQKLTNAIATVTVQVDDEAIVIGADGGRWVSAWVKVPGAASSARPTSTPTLSNHDRAASVVAEIYGSTCEHNSNEAQADEYCEECAAETVEDALNRATADAHHGIPNIAPDGKVRCPACRGVGSVNGRRCSDCVGNCWVKP